MRRVVGQIRLVAFFIANRGSAVDARKASRKSISEVSKDHKDALAAKRKSGICFDASCQLEDKGDT
jgi:hypothetical protein